MEKLAKKTLHAKFQNCAVQGLEIAFVLIMYMHVSPSVTAQSHKD